MPDQRARRIARNEAKFRDINERLGAEVSKLTAPGERVRFVCECGSATCARHLSLDLDEYAAVRSDALTFAVIPGHEIPDLEVAVERHERFVVVRKPVDVAEELA